MSGPIDTPTPVYLCNQPSNPHVLWSQRHNSRGLWLSLVGFFYVHLFPSNPSYSPITQLPDGPVTQALKGPSKRLDASPGQVLFLWARAKGAVVVTTTSKEERLKEYLQIGNLGTYIQQFDYTRRY